MLDFPAANPLHYASMGRRNLVIAASAAGTLP
jgi:hypothetical protein